MWWKFLIWMSDTFPWFYQKVFRPLRRKWFRLIYVYPALADALLGVLTSDKKQNNPNEEEK